MKPEKIPYFRLLLASLLLLLIVGCADNDGDNSPAGASGDLNAADGDDEWTEDRQNSDELFPDGDASMPSTGDDSAGEPGDYYADGDAEHSGGGAYPPMLSDPDYLPIIFGDEMLSQNINFGDIARGNFSQGRPYIPYTFDALPGAEITISYELIIERGEMESGPILYLYGPQKPTGLWEEAIAISGEGRYEAETFLFNQPLDKGGNYLIVLTSYERIEEGAYKVTLGCSDLCREPFCPDLTCQSFCEQGQIRDVNGCPTCYCRNDNLESECFGDDDCPFAFQCIDGICEMSDEEDPPEECECDTDYNPVCGEDGITYPNACEAACFNVSIAYQGECETQGGQACVFDTDCAPDELCSDEGQCIPAPDCPCPDEYAPVCGDDLRTYANVCEMECYGAVLLHEGPCGDEEASCEPICRRINTGAATEFWWVDSCSQEQLTQDDCMGCDAVCLFADMRIEGWYSSCGSSLIQIADCAPPCGCEAIWEPVCTLGLETYPNACEALCAGERIAYVGECDPRREGCDSNSECPAGQVCAYDEECNDETTDCHGFCTAPPGETSCITDDDCPSGFHCIYTTNGGFCADLGNEDCTISGCNGEVCASSAVATDCYWRPEYACFADALCKRLDDGLCGWTDGAELEQCLDSSTANDAGWSSCLNDTDCPEGFFCDRWACIESQCVCPDTQAPVCADNGKTYANACTAACNGASPIAGGACR